MNAMNGWREREREPDPLSQEELRMLHTLASRASSHACASSNHGSCSGTISAATIASKARTAISGRFPALEPGAVEEGESAIKAESQPNLLN